MRTLRCQCVPPLVVIFVLLCALLFGSLTGEAAMTRRVPAAFEHSLALNDSPLQLTDDYVEIPHDPALVPYSDAITLEAWVSLYPLNLDACNTVISKDLLDSYWLGICNQHIRYYSNGDWQDGSTVIPAHVWTHIAVVWEHGDQRRYYLNGELEYTGDAGPTTARPRFTTSAARAPAPPAARSTASTSAAFRPAQPCRAPHSWPTWCRPAPARRCSTSN